MKYGSTFTGIGGIDIAVEHVFGAEPAWHVEPDAYAAAVLRARWPGVPNLHRIEWVGSNVCRPDIICGGFPCQDISVAGSGAGLDGSRSGLFWQLARAIGLLRPPITILENVAAIAARGLDAVIGELSRLRYDAAWGALRAADVGAPHLRDRMFIVAVEGGLSDADRDRLRQVRERAGAPRAAAGLAGHDGEEVEHTDEVDGGQRPRVRERERQADGPGAGVAHHHHHHRRQGQRAPYDDHRGDALRDDAARRCASPQWPPGPSDTEAWSRWPGARPGVRRRAYGNPRGVDARRRRARLRCLGNAVVPAQAAAAIDELLGRLGA